jgi:myo-inositol-1(or 4)-monophosphatase
MGEAAAPDPGHLDRSSILALAERVAREAGELLLERQGDLEALHVQSKSSARDLVTAVDLASERLIVERLRAAHPDHAIEAEEETRDAGGNHPDELRWYLDPLDGTVNYVHGLPIFCVSMALFAGHVPQVAVVHAPVLRETFTATAGGGCYLNGTRVSVRATADLGEAVLATGFPYRRGELEHSNLENFCRFFYDVRGMRRMGSAALDLAYVAAGRLDGFWELHLSPHDVAAGALLVREAGGIVTDAEGGEDWLRGGHLVAAGEILHAKMLPRIQH